MNKDNRIAKLAKLARLQIEFTIDFMFKGTNWYNRKRKLNWIIKMKRGIKTGETKNSGITYD